MMPIPADLLAGGAHNECNCPSSMVSAQRNVGHFYHHNHHYYNNIQLHNNQQQHQQHLNNQQQHQQAGVNNHHTNTSNHHHRQYSSTAKPAAPASAPAIHAPQPHNQQQQHNNQQKAPVTANNRTMSPTCTSNSHHQSPTAATPAGPTPAPAPAQASSVARSNANSSSSNSNQQLNSFNNNSSIRSRSHSNKSNNSVGHNNHPSNNHNHHHHQHHGYNHRHHESHHLAATAAASPHSNQSVAANNFNLNAINLGVQSTTNGKMVATPLATPPNNINVNTNNNKSACLSHYKYHNDSHSSVLTYEQVKRLDFVMDQTIPIYGRGNFPTLYVKLKELIRLVRTKLQDEHSIEIRDIRLNGGAASYILAPENSQYNDLDLIFATDLSDEDKFDVIRDVVLDCLKEFFPNQNNSSASSTGSGINHDEVTAPSVKPTQQTTANNEATTITATNNKESTSDQLEDKNATTIRLDEEKRILLKNNNLVDNHSSSSKINKINSNNLSDKTNDDSQSAIDKHHRLNETSPMNRINNEADAQIDVASLSLSSLSSLPHEEKNQVANNNDNINERRNEGGCIVTTAIASSQTPLKQSSNQRQQQTNQYQAHNSVTHQFQQMPLSSCAIKEAYVHKMVKVNEGDRWSLISLGVQQTEANQLCHHTVNYMHDNNQQSATARNGHQHHLVNNRAVSFNHLNNSGKSVANSSPDINNHSIAASNTHLDHHHHHNQPTPQAPNNIELKFVDRMRRKFEFSVDSFQIILDSLLQFYDCAPTEANHHSYLTSDPSVSASTSSVASSSGCSSSSSIVSSSSSAVSCDGDYDDLYGYDNDNILLSSSSSTSSSTTNEQQPLGSSRGRSYTVISKNFYPTVVGQSEYGNFKEALYHLENKLIATRSPEEIRGGGLLKYCNLLVRNYKPTNNNQIRTLERYMCSRFFIDFSDLSQQQAKLESYLANHFSDDALLKFDYLTILFSVVQRSTVCLMSHELRLTLNMIRDLAYKINFDHQRQQHQTALDHHHHHHQKQLLQHQQHQHMLQQQHQQQHQEAEACINSDTTSLCNAIDNGIESFENEDQSISAANRQQKHDDLKSDCHISMTSQHDDGFLSNEILSASKESPDSLIASDIDIEDDVDDGVLSDLTNDSTSINVEVAPIGNSGNGVAGAVAALEQPIVGTGVLNNNVIAVIPNSCCQQHHNHGCVTTMNSNMCHVSHLKLHDHQSYQPPPSMSQQQQSQSQNHGHQAEQQQQQQEQQQAHNRVLYFKLIDCMECRCRYLAIQSCSLCACPVHLTIA